MTKINKVAVIGSGVMGAGIAAHLANANVDVLLLDIVTDPTNSNLLVNSAFAKITAANAQYLTHEAKAKYITIGNLTDDFHKLTEMDWIIEVVIEKLEIKQVLYHKIDAIRKIGSIVSSNTSTLPLSMLTMGVSAALTQDFMISHFFNPPRFMRLLELITGPNTSAVQVQRLSEFMDLRLGKGIVLCNDTPGFIANRIGCFWLETAIELAIKMNITIESADSTMGKKLGFPSTGVFGLIDLIGLDLMPLMANSLMSALPPEDDFSVNYRQHDVIKNMIKAGQLGRKTGAGFYKISKKDGKKTKEVMDLTTGEYRPFVVANDASSDYSWAVLSRVLNYAAKLVGMVADDITSIDRAMKLGYNWQFGPFELIDQFQTETESGPSWFCKKLLASNMTPAPILDQVGSGSFYKSEHGRQYYFGLAGYVPVPIDPQKLSMHNIKLSEGNCIVKNDAASLWNLGDSVYCFELDSKMNSLSLESFALLDAAINLTASNAKALVIASDQDVFSVGANLKYLLELIENNDLAAISTFIQTGQDVLFKLKHAPFPVVSAVCNLALGGGAEALLASASVVAHLETSIGLVESSVGLLPGWGGCAELFFRSMHKDPSNYTALAKVFSNILNARKASNAEYAIEMMLLNEHDQITMNIERVLFDSKQTALSIVDNFIPNTAWQLTIDGGKIRICLEEVLAQGSYSDDEIVIGRHLINIFRGGSDNVQLVDQKILCKLEQKAFLALCQTENCRAKITAIVG